MRDILTGLAILVILLLSAVAIAPHFIDWSQYRAQIEDRAGTAIGKPVKITGPVNLRLLPAPVLRIGEFRIGGAEDHISATARKAKVELSVTALLRGEFRITDATLEEPVLHVRADRPGAENTVVVPTLQDIPLAAIDNLTIVEGTVRHTSLSGKQSQPVRGNFTVEAVSFKGPWRVTGRVTADDRSYDVRITTGTADAQARVPLKIAIADAGLAFIADLDGVAAADPKKPGALPKIEGRVNASGTFAWPFGKQAGTQPWRLQAQGFSTEAGFSATSLEIEAGPAETPLRAEGSGELAIAEGWDARLALKARPFDSDKLRAANEPARTMPAQSDIVAMMEQALVAPPFPVTLTLEGDSIIANGEAVGPYRMDARLTRGRFRIDRAEAALPGQARLSASGTAALGGLPQFDGRVALTSSNPAKTWSWFSGSTSDAAQGARFARLRDIKLEAGLSATPAVATAQDLKIIVDGATVTGEARYRFARDGNRSRLDAAIAADTLDVDLFPALQSAGGSGAGASAGRDYALNIDAKNLTARSLGIESIGALAIIVRAEESGLHIERFDLRGSDAARIAGAGKIGPAGGRIDSVIEADNVAPLLVAAQRLFPALQWTVDADRARALNPVRMTVSLEQASAREDMTAT
ncbi:MAG: AsmA family protein, partial [Beijerinckiaceae bacterium]